MPWLLILRSPWTYAAAALVAMGAYAAVQHIGWKLEKANFAQFRAQVASEAAEAEARNAHVALQQELNTQEAIDDLQTRYAALNARYASLRQSASPSGSPVPALPGPSATPSPGPTGQPDAAARCVADAQAVLELGDRELAKYRELWELERKQAGQ